MNHIWMTLHLDLVVDFYKKKKVCLAVELNYRHIQYFIIVVLLSKCAIRRWPWLVYPMSEIVYVSGDTQESSYL